MTPSEFLALFEQFKLEHPDAPEEMFDGWLELQNDLQASGAEESDGE